MKKEKDIESRIYELLGVKQFRKAAFFLRDCSYTLVTLKKSKEERKHELYKEPSNYNIGIIRNVEDIKKHKKQIYSNTLIHTVGLVLCMSFLPEVFTKTISLSSSIAFITATIINLYCLMLQRYTYIRMKKAIEKATLLYEKQKEHVREKIREKEETLEKFEKHSYKIVQKESKKSGMPKEIELTLEELMENASLEELNRYKRNLMDMQMIMSLREDIKDDSSRKDVELSIGENKYLKLVRK